MRDISAKRAVELSWDKVRSIVAEEIKEILGLQVQCKVNVVEGSFWDVTFISYRLPLPKLCQNAGYTGCPRGLGGRSA